MDNSTRVAVHLSIGLAEDLVCNTDQVIGALQSPLQPAAILNDYLETSLHPAFCERGK
jgi:hypothetical protein